MSIRAVYFDLGGVILRTEDKGPRTALAESIGLDYAGIDRLVFDMQSSRQASTGVISEEQHWRNTVRDLSLPESEAPRIMKAFFAGDRIDDGLVDFLRSLRSEYKVGLISNAFSGLRAWILREKLDDAFDAMTISAEVGVEKPNQRIYLHALDQLNIRAEEAIFVDDMPANITAANTLGMHGILFKTSEQAIAEIKKQLAA